MIEPIILAKGHFKPENLSISVSESNRKINPKIEIQIDDLWKVRERKAKEEGRRMYNGICYRLNSLKTEGDKISIDLGVVDYKTRECLIEAEGYYETTEEYWTKGAHTIATVKTSDDKYLLVQLSGKSMNTNKVEFLGGIMETEPPIKSGDDLFKSLFSELEEEAFIEKEDIANSVLSMVYLNSKTKAGFYFEILLNITSEQLKKRFDSQIKELDIKSLMIMSRKDYIYELENHNTNKQFVAKQVEI